MFERISDRTLRADDRAGGRRVGTLKARTSAFDRGLHALLEAVEAVFDGIAHGVANSVSASGGACVAPIDGVQDARERAARRRGNVVSRSSHMISLRRAIDDATARNEARITGSLRSHVRRCPCGV